MAEKQHASTSGDPNDPRKARSMSKLAPTGAPAEAASKGSAADERTRDELYQRAAALGINGRSRMTKEHLARAIELHERGES